MKKKVLVVLLIVVIVGLLLISLGRKGYTYPEGGSYTAGGTSVSGDVKSIDISWLDGMVNVAYHEGDEIILSESTTRSLTDKTELHWRVKDGSLSVKYASSGFKSLTGLEKRLTVLLPEGLKLKEMNIVTASAPVQADGLEAGQAEIVTASGSVTVEAKDVGKLKVTTASGSVDVMGVKVDEAEMTTASGAMNLRFSSAPARMSASTLSGSVTVCLPQNAGFTADLSSVSGTVSGSMLMERKSDSLYVGGDGRCLIDVNTVSGEIRLDSMK